MNNTKLHTSHQEDHQQRNRGLSSQRQGTGIANSYFGSISQMFQEMDRIMNSSLQTFGMPNLTKNLSNMQNMMFSPYLEVTSNETEYTIRAEMAGMDPKDIHVELLPNGTLLIEGEKRMNERNRDHNYHLSERSYGSFHRTLPLPESVIKESIVADFENGVLTISAEKRAASAMKPQIIEINAGEHTRQRSHIGGSRQESRQQESRNEAGNASAKKVA